jgi:hypothetical protein
MTSVATPADSRALPERPPISAPRAGRAHRAGQPALGLAGLTLVAPVALVLALGFGSLERSLFVLGPISTFALPVVAMIAFWWEDWPGTIWRAPLSGLADTVLVVVGGVVSTVAGQAIVSHVDLRGLFDPAAAAGDAPTFPHTMPLAAAIFTVMLQLTLVGEGFPLRRLDRYLAGSLALALSWAAGVALQQGLVRTGVLAGGEFGAILVCIATLQVAFYVVLRGWPFSLIGRATVRLPAANAVVIGGGWGAYQLLAHAAGLAPPTISAVAGCVVAAGLIVGMQFEGSFEAMFAPPLARIHGLTVTAAIAALLYVALQALADGATWTRAEPEDWTAYAALNAIGLGVILHVAIGRRWPFAAQQDGGRA